MLHTSGTVHDGRTLLYSASKLDCDTCPLKARCCPGQLARKIPRDVHEDARDMARAVDGVESLRKVPRRAQTRRDALCTPKNPARLRAHAAQRSVRRARRIPSRCYRAEPQDPGAPSPRAPGCATFRVVCVTASEDRATFKGKDCPISSRICRLNGSPIENIDFFDSIGVDAVEKGL